MNIDFTASAYNCGKAGEHNAESLVITVPEGMRNEGSSYRIAFWGVAKNLPVRTDDLTMDSENKITYSIPQSITSLQEAEMTLEEYNGIELLRKSKMVLIKFDVSVPDGEDGVSDTPPVIAQINANTEARHTHFNESDLNKVMTADNGNFKYDDDIYYTADDVDDLLDGVGKTIEIETYSMPPTSKYTPEQLSNLVNDGNILTYQGNICICNSYGMISLDEFAFRVIVGNSIIPYKVTANKSIVSSGSTIYFAKSVNNKTFPVSGEITLDASDVGASPSNHTHTDKASSVTVNGETYDVENGNVNLGEIGGAEYVGGSGISVDDDTVSLDMPNASAVIGAYADREFSATQGTPNIILECTCDDADNNGGARLTSALLEGMSEDTYLYFIPLDSGTVEYTRLVEWEDITETLSCVKGQVVTFYADTSEVGTHEIITRGTGDFIQPRFIADADNNFTSKTVEGALSELSAQITDINAEILGINSALGTGVIE